MQRVREGGREVTSSQCKESLKGKTSSRKLHAFLLLDWVRHAYVAVGCKTRGDFCNFPQNHVTTVISCLSSFWLTILRSLGSPEDLEPFVAFLGISRYTG